MPGLYSKRNSEVRIQKKQKGSEGFKINPSDPFFFFSSAHLFSVGCYRVQIRELREGSHPMLQY